MDVNVTTADGHAFKASCYKQDDGYWCCSIHRGYPASMYIDLQRDYDDSAECKPIGWKARPSNNSQKAMPQHAGLRGAGKTMGQALTPFFEVVRAADRCAAEQTAFRNEQQTIINEICACYEPDEALRLLDRARAALVLDWNDWNGHHGGVRKNGVGWELAKVAVPVDSDSGVVVWTATKWTSCNSYKRHGGYITFDDIDRWNKPNRRAAVSEARELADAWLREQGVLQ